jgi:hypothetical protein
MDTITKPMHLDLLHFEHQLWLNDVKFYNDELKIYQKHLEEVAKKNTGKDVMRYIEHFQNQFIIQKEQLDILKHNINEHENWISKYAKENPVAIEHKAFADHSDMREQIISFKKIYTELKTEFKHFVAQWI